MSTFVKMFADFLSDRCIRIIIANNSKRRTDTATGNHRYWWKYQYQGTVPSLPSLSTMQKKLLTFTMPIDPQPWME